MACPNLRGDPAFNQVLVNLVGRSDCDLRTRLFWFVCVPVRASLYGAAWYFRDAMWLPWAVWVTSLVSAANLWGSLETPGQQWWSKRWQLLMSTTLFLTSAWKIMKPEQVPSYVIPALLFSSLLGGILQRLLR